MPARARACAVDAGPAANSAGWPASSEKPSPRLWRLMPVFGSASHEPRPEAFDWISDTPMPLPSTVQRYVVSPRSPGPWRCDDLWRSISSARAVDRIEQRPPVGAIVEDGGPVEAGGGRALDQDVRPLRIVGIVGKADLLGEAERGRA